MGGHCFQAFVVTLTSVTRQLQCLSRRPLISATVGGRGIRPAQRREAPRVELYETIKCIYLEITETWFQGGMFSLLIL